MPHQPLDNIIADLRTAIRHDVAGGFVPLSDIVERAVAYIGDDGPAPTVRELAERYTRVTISEHLADQATWPSRTDCDRLDDAFAALEAEGILARHDYSCCGTCGAAEIWDELQDHLDAGNAVRGYTFYHQQDTESAVDGGGVFLNYGATEDSDEAITTIAQRVVAVLQTHGLKAEWSGDLDKRIQVPLVWRRRRVEEGDG